MHIALGMKEEEQSKPKAVKFKVDEESDSDGLFDDDDDMSSDSSDSDDSELEVTGGYYTKEMFLKKYVLASLICSYAPFCVLLTCCCVP